MNDSDEHARRFREAARQMASSMTDTWICVGCGKENRADRSQCWKCGKTKDAVPSESLHKEGSASHLVTEQTVPKNRDASAGLSRTPTSAQDAVEIKSLISRYWDAYVVARVTAGMGEAIKAIAVVLAALISFGALVIAGQVGGGGAIATFFAGVIAAAFIGGQFYLLGVIVMAQGQILKASLDCAVNSSPFLQNEHRAKIMSLK